MACFQVFLSSAVGGAVRGQEMFLTVVAGAVPSWAAVGHAISLHVAQVRQGHGLQVHAAQVQGLEQFGIAGVVVL